jgi:hypothetical protein
MTHCRMCSQRLTRPGRLCRECERELSRARLAGVSIEPCGVPATDEAALAMAARGTAGTRWLRGRAPVVVAALAIGAAIAATLHASQRSDGADVPRSVMLERDLSDLRPRAFAPVAAPVAKVERAAASEPTARRVAVEASAVRAVAAEPAPNAVPPNARPRVVRIASVTANAAAPIERVAQVEPAERGAVPAITRAPSYDRVLAFSDALARCGEETFFARLVCEERARSRFCNGAGDLPQCASAPPRDYGN